MRAGKLAVLSGPMRAEREAVVTRITALAQKVPAWADLGRGAICEGVSQMIAALDIYRPYTDAEGCSLQDRARIMAAVEHARRKAPGLDPAIWHVLAGLLPVSWTAG